MSSILTNNGAMVALQTLKTINSNLTQAQSEISTGKSVGSAKDNSALWAISKVMESDVKGFQAISESLSLGESTVAVGRQAAETVTDLLTEVKGKIVAAQEENVDRTKIQADIEALTNQIKSVVGAAQFNGLNLLGEGDAVNILSSLDRSSDGTVSANNISIDRQNLTSASGTFGANTADAPADPVLAAASAGGATPTTIENTAKEASRTYTGAVVVGEDFSVTVGEETVNFTAATTNIADLTAGLADAINAAGITGITADGATGTAGELIISNTNAFKAFEVSANTNSAANTSSVSAGSSATLDARSESIDFASGTPVEQGDSYRVTLGGANYDYVADKGETFEDVARGLQSVINSAGLDNISTNVEISASGQVSLQIDNDGAAAQSIALDTSADGTATGGLFGLDNLDVTSTSGANAALDSIETLIDTSIDSAAQFGSDQSRLEIQSEFIGKLSDSLKSGIGSLVDADLEETSARLQALQVQQQLGTQALSIANQAPQSLLSLFR